ncbi:MAG TPA: hypothetical protein VMM12_00305, partial [Longimicrobiales bacterium]|nr:hypothetical protein [Longimicrobiales bacterium]
PEDPFEIAYFDRGPVSADELLLGGVWSAYWYNGRIYGSEIGRGLDVLQLTPSEHLSRNEIEAAQLVHDDVFNPQTQARITWPADFVVARAYLDQLRRTGALAPRVAEIASGLERAEGLSDAGARGRALRELAGTAEGLVAGASAADRRRLEGLAETLRALAGGS